MSRPSGDAWVFGPDGTRYWGRFGAAGLLVRNPDGAVLLQHRVEWSHFGGTWGIPGGARHEDESAVEAALRESNEEAGVPRELVEVRGTSVLDLSFWSYTTVIAVARQRFTPVIADPESLELAWVQPHEVTARALHPGFAMAWPELRTRLVS